MYTMKDLELALDNAYRTLGQLYMMFRKIGGDKLPLSDEEYIAFSKQIQDAEEMVDALTEMLKGEPREDTIH